MFTSHLAGASRQAIILATIGGLHVGAFVLAVSGLVPRLDLPRPVPPPFIYLPSKPQPPSPVAPGRPEPGEYSPPRLPVPPVQIPDFGPPQAPRVGGTSSTQQGPGTGPGVPVRDVRAPSLRVGDSRIAMLVDACYPAASRRMGEEGRVVVRAEVDVTGRASAWDVAESSGFARLDAAVACVIRRLRFNPGRRGGAAVSASVLLPIVFRLN